MSFAFIFESVGGTEWFVLLGVILIVVGPKNLPSAARKLGQIMTNLRRAADEFKRQLMSMDQEVRKEVDSAIADTPSTPDSSTGSESDTSSDTSPYDGSDSYSDDNPYPGHEDYYDETSYENYYGDSPEGDAGNGESGDEKPSDETPSAPAQPPPPTDEELRRVKITVSAAPGKGK